MKILIAEDNPVNARLLKTILDKLHVPADVAVTGRDAVIMHRQKTYQIVFMDCQMPEMDGFEATQEIRRYEGTSAHTCIIAVTANAMPGDKERCLQAGMDDYLAKPVRQSDILGMIQKWFPSFVPVNSHSNAESPLRQPVISPLRIEELLNVGGEELLHELIHLYVMEGDLCLKDLKRGQEQQNPHLLSEAAHKLKGSSKSIGAEFVAELCKILEEKSSGAGSEELDKRLTTLEAEYELAKSELTSKYLK